MPSCLVSYALLSAAVVPPFVNSHIVISGQDIAKVSDSPDICLGEMVQGRV